MADLIFLSLFFIHIFSIVFWLGGNLLVPFTLVPAGRKMSLRSRGEYVSLLTPPITRALFFTSTIAIVAGGVLYYYINFVATSYAPSSSGLVWIQAGAIIALIKYILAIIIEGPGAKKIAKAYEVISIASSAAPSPTVQVGGDSDLVKPPSKLYVVVSILSPFILTSALLCMVIGANI